MAAKEVRRDKIAVLVECLDDMEKASYALRDALLARRADAIWSALEVQERAVLRLEQIRQDLGLSAGKTLDDSLLPPDRRSSLRESLARTRIVQRLNRSLTRVFLDLIDKTLNTIHARSGAHPLTYGPDGSVGRATGPLFVQQTG